METQGFKKTGRPRLNGRDKTRLISIRLSEEIISSLEEKAKEYSMTRAGMARYILDMYLKRQPELHYR